MPNFILSSAAIIKEMSILAVPHVQLIDGNSITVFKGHPAHRNDIVMDILKLAKGEALS